MNIVVISSSRNIPNEVRIVVDLFELGLAYFHIRKPRFSKADMAKYIEEFPGKYRKRLILHSYHKLAGKYNLGGIHFSRKHRERGKFYKLKLLFFRIQNPHLIITRTFHRLSDLSNDKRNYTYSFLSPVFDSISHSSLSAGFSKRALQVTIPENKHIVYALGGIRPENIALLGELGFSGAALLGSIWSEKNDPREIYMRSVEAGRQILKN